MASAVATEEAVDTDSSEEIQGTSYRLSYVLSSSLPS